MKYYIPTSSLNFNNILSTESISPASYYSARNFGYSRWTLVPENNFQNMVLLYDSPGFFTRPKCDVEDHPLLVEVHTDKVYPKLENGIFYSDKTINLNALTDRFIFFSESNKRTALSLLDSSLESKMGRLFEGRVVVRDCDRTFPQTHAADVELNKEGVASEQRINRTKGLLYGYYIGALLSCDKVDLIRINRFRQLQGIFAAILSSPNRKASSSQNDVINQLLREIEVEDPIYVKLLAVLGGNGNSVDEVLRVLREEGKEVLSFNPSRVVADLAYGDPTTNRSMLWAKSSIDALKAVMRKKRSYLSVDTEELIVCDGAFERIAASVIPDEDDNAIACAWVKDVLSQLKYTGKISSTKAALATDLTTRARDLLGAKWEGSSQRAYLNKLRRHIGGESFDVPWANGILSSIAAVLLKGDSWDGLVRFMQSKEMTDYRLAMAFYGELNGFANLTRDCTDLLLNANKDYVRSVYKEFHGQLYGTSICTEEEIKYDESVFVRQSERKDKEVTSSTAIKTAEMSELPIQILAYFESKDSKFRGAKGGSKEALRNGLKLALAKAGSRIEIVEFLDDLAKNFASYGWGKTAPSWKKLQKKFSPHKEVQAELPVVQGCGHREGSGTLYDRKWLDECANQISGIRARGQFISDVERFFADDNNPESPWYGQDKSNKEVLARLEKWLRSPWSVESLSWKLEKYGNSSLSEINQVLEYLRSRYV